MALNKPSHELVVDLINTDNTTTFTYDNLIIDEVIPFSGTNGINTRARVIPEEGIPYSGFQYMHYRRLDLAVEMQPDEGSGDLEIMVPNDGFVDTYEVCERLNVTYALQLGSDDVVYAPLDLSTLPVTIDLVAKSTSQAWVGQRSITFVVGRPMYSTTFSSTTLDGFVMPSSDVSSLTGPTASTNVAPTFSDGAGHLRLLSGGNTTLSNVGFCVTTNGEVEVAGAIRVTAVEVIPDSDNTYTVTLGGTQNWYVWVSLGMLAETASLTAQYTPCVVITGPDGTSLMLMIEEQSDHTFKLVNTDYGISVDFQTPFTSPAPYAVMQGFVGVRQFAARLGAATLNSSGTPLGMFSVRVQARRKDSITPRVIASFNAKVLAQ
jgi:hypothetical protein